MKISKVIEELEAVRREHGEIQVRLQNDPTLKDDIVTNYDHFFMVVEEYDNGPQVSVRTWPC